MPLDMNLLYGEMVGSAAAHAAIPIGVSLLLGFLPYMEPFTKLLIFIGLCVVASFLVQLAFLTMLQTVSCGGVKVFGGVATGAAIAAIITLAMLGIPAFLEPMRLVVSQLLFDHKVLLTPQLADMQKKMVDAALEISGVSGKDTSAITGLSHEEYEKQTFDEIKTGAAYWAAFAGAYGVGIGSLFAAKCN
jgi:hypothetical protein